MARDPGTDLFRLYDGLAEGLAAPDEPDPPLTLDEARERRRRLGALRARLLETVRASDERRERPPLRAL